MKCQTLLSLNNKINILGCCLPERKHRLILCMNCCNLLEILNLIFCEKKRKKKKERILQNYPRGIVIDHNLIKVTDSTF